MNMQPSYFQSYPDPFYDDWKTEPVPGWGVRPVMAGPRMVAVGDSTPPKLSGCVADPKTGKGYLCEIKGGKLVCEDCIPESPFASQPFYKQRWFVPAVGITIVGIAVAFLLKDK